MAFIISSLSFLIVTLVIFFLFRNAHVLKVRIEAITVCREYYNEMTELCYPLDPSVPMITGVDIWDNIQNLRESYPSYDAMVLNVRKWGLDGLYPGYVEEIHNRVSKIKEKIMVIRLVADKDDIGVDINEI